MIEAEGIKKNRAVGAYLGAAIGDAMGGPAECSHASRIRRLVGEITGFLPYQKPWSFHDPHPGYCLRPDPGCVTDDTFIRADFTRFFLVTRPPRSPRLLADWMLTNADFSGWWPPLIEALRRVERGEVSAEEGGLTFFQGGGIGWWTPVGILHAGNPKRACGGSSQPLPHLESAPGTGPSVWGPGGCGGRFASWGYPGFHARRHVRRVRSACSKAA
jgi:ADP-ribosylglycohydrolase